VHGFEDIIEQRAGGARSNTTGTFCVSTFTAWSRRRARPAAVRPTSSGDSRAAKPRAMVYQ